MEVSFGKFMLIAERDSQWDLSAERATNIRGFNATVGPFKMGLYHNSEPTKSRSDGVERPDERKYNIEHGIPLTAEQRKQHDAIERTAPPGAVYIAREDNMANRDQERKQERDLATNQWERRIAQGMAARSEDKKVEIGPVKHADEEKERSGQER